MLRRYVDWEGFNNHPAVGNLIRWTSKGDFETSLPETKETITHPTYGTFKKSVLVAIEGKRSHVPIFLWKYLDTFPLDGNESNISIENLIWQGSNDKLSYSDLPGYRIIPGYSRYVINRDGIILDLIKRKYLESKIRAPGYRKVILTPDVGKRGEWLVHRLLGYAFLPYGNNVCELDINHKDGNKANNHLSNLEWATRVENCYHAYSTGLREENKPVLVRDVRTNEVREFFSMAEAARVTGIKRLTILMRMHNKEIRTYFPGLQFKFVSDNRDWPEVTNLEKELQETFQKRRIRFRDLSTGKDVIYKSLSDCERDTGIKVSTISYRLRNNVRQIDNVIIEALPLELES